MAQLCRILLALMNSADLIFLPQPTGPCDQTIQQHHKKKYLFVTSKSRFETLISIIIFEDLWAVRTQIENPLL